jgi:hypothetical protein
MTKSKNSFISAIDEEVLGANDAFEDKFEAKTPKQKSKYTILKIDNKIIRLSYTVNGVKYGMHMPFNEKYKDSKPGDVISL